MSYTPTNWQTGDTITAEKLNNMESGIENANNPFIVTLTPTAQDLSGTMDKTDEEIRAAFDDGKRIMLTMSGGALFVNASQINPFEIDGRSVAAARAEFVYYANGNYMLVQIETAVGDKTYTTTIFPLTPMS